MEPDWLPGHTLHRSNAALQVVRAVDAEPHAPDDLRGYLVVRPVGAEV
jgi:hypothetical protein